MKSVLISTDFVVRQDGTLTPLEINTNTRADIPIYHLPEDKDDFVAIYGDFFDYLEFDLFLKENNITKIITIDSQGGSYTIIKSFANFFNYEFEEILIPDNSVTVPDIPDQPDTLIIRISYDSYSLLDDLYARDMYEFHNLIKDEPFASPVTYKIEDGIVLDTIVSYEPSQDGIIPNYVLKSRLPNYKPTEYPKIYRYDNITELDNLKQSISPDEFIQKYEHKLDELTEDGRTYFFRSMDLIYGSNLDVQHLISYCSSNSISTQNELLRYNEEIDSQKKLNDLVAAKYYPSYISRFPLSFHFDQTDNVLLTDGTVKNVNTLVVNDIISSVKFNDEIGNFDPSPVTQLDNFEIGPSTVMAFAEHTNPGIFVNIKASSPSYGTYEFYDGVSNFYLIQKAGSDMAEYIGGDGGDLSIGDNIFVYDRLLNKMVPLTIEDIFFDVKTYSTYLMTLEPFSEFFVELDTDLFLVQHNACNTSCGVIFFCPNTRCLDCSKTAINCPLCGLGGAITVTCIKQ